MDTDDPAAPQPARRASTAHDRPSRAPSGPRIRTRQKHSFDLGPHSADASPLGPPPDSPGAHFSPPSIDASLPHLPFPTLPPPLNTHADAAVQTPATPPPPPLPPPSPPPAAHMPRPAAAPQKPAVATFIAPPPLTPPPPITFESTPIPWKGLPFEAAQWTFSSSELQDIVSKAIRLSARESFVRLLSPQALEVDIVHETQRLDTERATAQAKWRFEVGRRTMLMQALNSSAASSVPSTIGDSGGGNPIMGFIGQLASSISSCDALLSSILHVADHQSQIALVQHQHWASALGVALRKLNRAYERQGQELKRTQARVQTLEDELEEAWREAEKMAIEFDDFEQEVAADTEDGSEGLNRHPAENPLVDVDGADTDGSDSSSVSGLVPSHDPDETGTLGDATINTDIAVVRGVTATAVASKATLVTSPGSPTFPDKGDAKSVRSVKSTRSRRSGRDGQSHTSRLSAARTRSRTASNASLRLPKALRSPISIRTPPMDVPPIPALPQEHSSFLDMDNVGPEHARKDFPPQRHPEPTQALPTLPHATRNQGNHVPSIWLETDGGQSTRLNGLDRSHSLHIFSSLISRTPRKTRRSNLVMSLTGSDRSSDGGAMGSPERAGVGSTSASASSASMGMGLDTGTGSPTSNSSPVSLPPNALAHFRGPSLSSSHSVVAGLPRPGSAGARLTTTVDAPTSMPVATPRRSLVSRASSVILRRLSHATTVSARGKGKVGGLTLALRSREALHLNGAGRPLERWGEGDADLDGEGEVMLIGSPHSELFDTP